MRSANCEKSRTKCKQSSQKAERCGSGLATWQRHSINEPLLLKLERSAFIFVLYILDRGKMSAPLENLENQLELFVENVRQVKIIVSDFQPQGQSVLNQKM